MLTGIMVWMICPHCGREYLYPIEDFILKDFNCDNCETELICDDSKKLIM